MKAELKHQNDDAGLDDKSSNGTPAMSSKDLSQEMLGLIREPIIKKFSWLDFPKVRRFHKSSEVKPI